FTLFLPVRTSVMDATAPAMSGHAIIPLMRSLGFDAAAQLALAQGKSYGASKDFSRRTRNRATDGQEDAAIQKQPHLSSRNRSYPPHPAPKLMASPMRGRSDKET